MNKLIGSILVSLFFVLPAKADLRVEVGPTYLSYDFAEGGILMFSERFGKYDLSLGYVSEQFVNTCGRPDCDFDLQENIFVHAQRIIQVKRCEIGIGPAWFQNTNRALGKQFTVAVHGGCNITDRFSVRIRHWSNAGSGVPNMGQDAITFGWAF